MISILNKNCLYLLVIVVLVLNVDGNDNEKKDSAEDSEDEDKEYIVSEKEFKGEEVIFTETVIPVSNLKVVQDNVSGNKHSAFSEDQSTNRADEQTISDIKKEAENRVLENEKKKLTQTLQQNLEVPKNNDETETDLHDGKPEPTNVDESNTNQEKTVDLAREGETDPLHDPGNANAETKPKVNSFVTEEEELLVIPDTEVESKFSPDDAETEIVDLDKEKYKLPLRDTSEDSVQKEKKILSELNTIETTFSNLLEPSADNSEENLSGNPTPPPSDDPLKEGESPLSHQQNHGDLGDEISNSNTPVEITKDSNAKKKESEPENEESKKLYEEALTLLEGEYKDKKRANRLLLAAADLNHTKSMEGIAYPLLFGDNIKRNETKSREIFQYLADKGSPVGQQGLGFMYGTGVSANSSQAKALIYTTFAALGGNTLAEIMLANRYRSGTGVETSCESALMYYKKVAKKVSDLASSLSGGNAVQRVRLYDELEQPGSNSGQIDQDLLQYYQYLADKGDIQAQIGLGQLYFQGGRGVDINYEKAFFYFNLAAETGNGNGLAYLGKMYLQGLRVEKDAKKAFEYFTKAVESKNPIGQAGLGAIYLKGEGVEKDYDKALKYFSQAAEQGWVEGQLQLGNMYYNGIGVKKDYRQAVKYFTFASQSGHVLAFYNLALMHATGAGVMRSCRTATELFKNVAERGKWSAMFMDAYDAYKKGDLKTALLKYYLLAELGYEVAQSNVAYMLDKDEATFFEQNQTYARALLQWSRAADQGYAVARVKLGDYYYYGLGTKVNYEAAALQYRLASDQQSNAQAMFNLGYMHEQGFGLKKDIHLAKRFYDMAAEASADAQFPVYLALAKLAINFSLEWIQKNYRFWEHVHVEKIQLYVLQNAGPDWDMYLISVLAGVLCILLLFRRGLRH